MIKKLMILLLSGCLTLFIGFKTFAADTANLGANPNASFTTNAGSDTYDSSTSNLDSDQTKNITDDNYRYGRYHHRGYGYERMGPRGLALFMLFSMMIIIIFLA